MIKQDKRMKDILELVEKLDISPSMYKDAIDKYKNIATYLKEKGIEADFYPQGSFSIGTVVRPYKDNKDANYDLDAICQINIEKESTTPQEIKESIENAFESDERYKCRLKKYDKCCTIEYADIDGIGFSIDIVPAVDEDPQTKSLLMRESDEPRYIHTAIAITDKKEDQYKWATNNPKGFKSWFENINKGFQEHSPQRSRASIFESYKYKGIFASIEEIPIELERSSLQRVIQILKRHRDVYFSKIANGDDLKPLSAIITTIATQIAKTAPIGLNVFDLLKYILSELEIYSKRQFLEEDQFSTKYENRNIIKRTNGEWQIENPVNPGDNLADAWNNNANIAKAFFNWIKYITIDFFESVNKTDEEFITILESAFGSEFVRSNMDVKRYGSSILPPKSINFDSQSKPWRKDNGN